MPTKTALILLIAAGTLTCSGGEPEWIYPSPAIDLPEEFTVVSRPTQRGRRTFPARGPHKSIAWEFQRGGDISQILMTRHGGSTSPEDVWSALNRLRTDNQTWTFNGPNSRQIDGRPAWDWTVTVPNQQGGLWAVEKTLIVSYPDSTWVSAFWGQHPEWHDEARLDQVLASFNIRQPPRPLPKHPIFVTLALLIAALVAWHKRPRPEPARPMPNREPVFEGNPNPMMPTEPGRDPMVTHR
ncbi:MAG: hypothetical protein ACR2QM_18010 [Longimicrobiales bacterium]